MVQPVMSSNTILKQLFSAQKPTRKREESWGYFWGRKGSTFYASSHLGSSWVHMRHIYDDLGYLRLRLKDGVTKVVSDC